VCRSLTLSFQALPWMKLGHLLCVEKCCGGRGGAVVNMTDWYDRSAQCNPLHLVADFDK
jgi:hypothetical protein